MTTGVVTGMRFEARCLERAGRRHAGLRRPRVAVSGASLARAEEAAREMAESGVSALLSFGIAGALEPDLHAGDLIIADRILDMAGHSFATDAAWAARLKDGLGDMRLIAAPLVSAAEVVATPSDKARLAADTGAVAVDTESAAVARAAAAFDLPVLAVRAIADTADETLPPAARYAIAPQGSLRVLAVLAGLMRRPGDFATVLALARGTGRARRTLSRVGLRCLPGLLRL